jgi:hypothetical protein
LTTYGNSTENWSFKIMNNNNNNNIIAMSRFSSGGAVLTDKGDFYAPFCVNNGDDSIVIRREGNSILKFSENSFVGRIDGFSSIAVFSIWESNGEKIFALNEEESEGDIFPLIVRFWGKMLTPEFLAELFKLPHWEAEEALSHSLAPSVKKTRYERARADFSKLGYGPHEKAIWDAKIPWSSEPLVKNTALFLASSKGYALYAKCTDIKSNSWVRQESFPGLSGPRFESALAIADLIRASNNK